MLLGLLFKGPAVLLMFIPMDDMGDASPTVWAKVGILIILAPTLFLWARKFYQ